MCGIFGYLNYHVPRSRKYIAETLIAGLQRLEYRGYDSAGIAFDGSNELTLSEGQKLPCLVVRQKGKVEELRKTLKVGMLTTFKISVTQKLLSKTNKHQNKN